MVDSMRIGIVGGVDRNAPALAGLARASGHELEHHTGVISGSASSLHLKALIGRSELVVVVGCEQPQRRAHGAPRGAAAAATAEDRPAPGVVAVRGASREPSAACCVGHVGPRIQRKRGWGDRAARRGPARPGRVGRRHHGRRRAWRCASGR